MCLILFAYRTHPDYELILLANRDEFYKRPTQPAAFWPDHPDILAGCDLEAGGTWLGITRTGRFATLTNYRQAGCVIADAPSRGLLVSDFLNSSETAADHLTALVPKASAYNGFNLLLRDRSTMFYYANRGAIKPTALMPGIYGLSNHLLDSPWPKVISGKQRLTGLLSEQRKPNSRQLLALLEDRCIPPDHELPDTGVGIERERILAPLFIESDSYGTRSSTALLIHRSGTVDVVEKTHPDAVVREFRFKLG
jgi:uncharacterized protein with NRDE domain